MLLWTCAGHSRSIPVPAKQQARVQAPHKLTPWIVQVPGSTTQGPSMPLSHIDKQSRGSCRCLLGHSLAEGLLLWLCPLLLRQPTVPAACNPRGTLACS